MTFLAITAHITAITGSSCREGLVNDRASHKIRYGDTVCAKVSEHQFLITRWHFIDETGACAFEERQKEVVVDNGFDNPYSYAVTEAYLTVMGE